MMYLTKKCFILLILGVTLQGCLNLNTGTSQEEYDELCPYERKYGGANFYLNVPLYIEPHKMIYKVGDTLTVRLELSDSILDLSRDMVFQIKDFPFNPNYYLYLVDEEGWHTGLARTRILTDSIYSLRVLQASAGIGGSLAGTSIYENGIYKYNFKFVFKEPGRYVSVVKDRVNGIFQNDDDAKYYPEYFEVENSSGCPEPWYNVLYILQGDPHYEEFAYEMRYVDDEVYLDRMTTLEDKYEYIWEGSRSSMTVEWLGVMGFEVVE